MCYTLKVCIVLLKKILKNIILIPRENILEQNYKERELIEITYRNSESKKIDILLKLIFI